MNPRSNMARAGTGTKVHAWTGQGTTFCGLGFRNTRSNALRPVAVGTVVERKNLCGKCFYGGIGPRTAKVTESKITLLNALNAQRISLADELNK